MRGRRQNTIARRRRKKYPSLAKYLKTSSPSFPAFLLSSTTKTSATHHQQQQQQQKEVEKNPCHPTKKEKRSKP
jgi:hypothetical protein